MDPDLGRFETVWASAGTQNSVFEVPPATLRMLANAIVAPIAMDAPGERRSDSSQASETAEAPAHSAR
jgi:hypothetical protein